MSGYNTFEQTVGGILDRYPRLKDTVESVYQRANYHLRVDSSFTYDLHEDATLYSAAEWFDAPNPTTDQFVGFYDICPWNDSMEAFLLHDLEEGGNPSVDASLVAVSNGERQTLARTSAWNYQQGSRLQWHPTRENAIIFNDIENGAAVARIIDTDGTVVRTHSYPLQAANPVEDEFISVSYRRLDHNSPGYGYGTLRDRASSPETETERTGRGDNELLDPDEDGLFRVSSDDTGTLVVPLSELMEFADGVTHERHYIHHVVYSPDGKQFVFLHRWRDSDREHTQLCVATRAGNPRLLLEDPYISHFSWIDTRRIFLWGRTDESGKGYYVVDVETGETEYMCALEGYGDGHPSVSPNGEWVVTDTYPDRSRKRHLTLYHRETERVVKLGTFLEPFAFDGQTRCDLHPRWSPDGQLVSIDSAFNGNRHSYVIDISEIMP